MSTVKARIKNAYLSAKNIDSVYEQLVLELLNCRLDVSKLYKPNFLRDYLERMMLYLYTESSTKLQESHLETPKKTVILLNAIAIKKVVQDVVAQNKKKLMKISTPTPPLPRGGNAVPAVSKTVPLLPTVPTVPTVPSVPIIPPVVIPPRIHPIPTIPQMPSPPMQQMPFTLQYPQNLQYSQYSTNMLQQQQQQQYFNPYLNNNNSNFNIPYRPTTNLQPFTPVVVQKPAPASIPIEHLSPKKGKPGTVRIKALKNCTEEHEWWSKKKEIDADDDDDGNADEKIEKMQQYDRPQQNQAYVVNYPWRLISLTSENRGENEP